MAILGKRGSSENKIIRLGTIADAD